MRLYLLLVLISMVAVNCQRKSVPAVTNYKENLLEIGVIDSIYSDVLKETRKIWIHLPESVRNGQADQTRFPVLYLLDGPAHFYSVTGMVKQLSSSNGNTIVPEMIIVAIPNTDRSRDLTPTHSDINFFTGDSIEYSSGGGDKFLDFIEKELIPNIEKNYPASSYRTFVGHSFGGLSVFNALVNRPNLFENYIAIDPSLWWDNRAFANYTDSLLSVNNFVGKSLFIGVANTMVEGMDIQIVESDTLTSSAHIRAILAFIHSIEKMTNNGLNFNWKYYDKDNHGSVPLISTYDGLRFFFEWYKFDGMSAFVDSSSTKEELITVVNDHYSNVSKHFGYNVIPPESFINAMGNGLLNLNRPAKALAFFEMNVRNYPSSSNAYHALGDCFLALEDTINATVHFSKAIELEKKANTGKDKKIK